MFAALFKVVEPVAVIAASLTTKSAFIIPTERRTDADLVRPLHNVATFCPCPPPTGTPRARHLIAARRGKRGMGVFVDQSRPPCNRAGLFPG